MVLKHSELYLSYAKWRVRKGPDTPHPFQFYFVISFLVHSETMCFCSVLSQGEDERFRMNCLKQQIS